MKLVFLGTRGYIEAKNRRHRRHASALVVYRGKKVMIDCGEDWLGRIDKVRPRAIVVTHPHPDHALGLREGAPCPVYATEEAWKRMEGFGIARPYRRVLELRRQEVIHGIAFEPFPVVHSTRAPAVGYRISAGRVCVFYVPDVVWIENRREALAGAAVYIGDGASVERGLVRKDDEGRLIGHASVRAQLTWCQKEGVSEMIVTHCGSGIVADDERTVGAKIRCLARGRGVRVTVAWDGLERILRSGPRGAKGAGA
jgi:ribonuclease BN (tRNA processing enzyme)